MSGPKYHRVYDFDTRGEPPKVFITNSDGVRVEEVLMSQPQIGEVYRHKTTNQKVVVRGPKTAEKVGTPDWEQVATRPHGDGDFSYLCGAEFCRCLS